MRQMARRWPAPGRGGRAPSSRPSSRSGATARRPARPRPHRCPAAASAGTSGPGTGWRSRHPGRNTRCRPADGPGTKCTPCGHQRADVADHRLLGGADIGQDRARREMRRDRLGQRRVGAHRRAQHDAVGALDRPRRIESRRGRRCRVRAPGRASPRCGRWPPPRPPARRARAAMRATELPISPMPSSARRRNSGSAIAPSSAGGHERRPARRPPGCIPRRCRR